MISPGIYEVVVSDVRLMTSKSNHPMLSLDYELLNDGRHIFDFYSLQPHVTWRLKKFLEIIGIKIEVNHAGELSFDTNDLLDKEFSIKIDKTLYKGRFYNKVISIIPKLVSEIIERREITNLELLHLVYPDIADEQLKKLLEVL